MSSCHENENYGQTGFSLKGMVVHNSQNVSVNSCHRRSLLRNTLNVLVDGLVLGLH